MLGAAIVGVLASTAGVLAVDRIWVGSLEVAGSGDGLGCAVTTGSVGFCGSGWDFLIGAALLGDFFAATNLLGVAA